MAGYSQDNSLTDHPIEGSAQATASPQGGPDDTCATGHCTAVSESDCRVTVDKLTELLKETYESSETRPAGKIRAITSLAKLHSLM